MGYGFKVGGSLNFKATINVQANANVTVTLSLDGSQVDSKTAGANGVVSFLVKKKGTYTVAHSSVASANVAVSQNKGTYSANIVYVTPADNLTAGGYQTGSAYVVWNNESGFRTGSIVQYSTSTYPTTYNGGSSAFGTSSTAIAIAVTNASTRYGFRQNISSGQTLYWTRFNYVTVNGSTYYSAYNASARASYTYASYAGKAVYTSGSGNWTVPTGVRSVVVFCVGGGGSGGTSSNHYSTYVYSGGGAGGGGGYTAQSNSIPVTPGMTASYSVGSGGAAVSGAYVSGKNGNTSTATVNGTTTSAGGGYGGGAGTTEEISHGGNGGSGGGAGGFNRSGSGASYTGGAGGTNGENGSKNSGNFGTGGTGQGRTTKFDNTTYSAGGSGGDKNSSGGAGTDGTGNGGQGSWESGSSGKGGSGTVIFKYS